MTGYASQIERIRNASSLEEIKEVARQYSAKAGGEGGILYSRMVGDVPSQAIALELAEKAHQPIIDSTPRAQFLTAAEQDIERSAIRIFRAQGASLDVAVDSASKFLYGDSKAVANSATSLDRCLWGEASREFAGSLRGDVKVVATAANLERVFGQVEIPAILNNPNVTSLGGRPITELKPLYAQGGAQAVLPEVQAKFVEAAPRGIFISPENVGQRISQVTVSKEVAASLGLDASRLSTAAELSAAGHVHAPIGMSPPTAIMGEAALAAEAAGARGLRLGTVVKGAGTVVAVAAVTYDVGTTAHSASQLYDQGNAFGAESKIIGAVSRNVGVFGGIALGAAGGAAVTSETGPGAVVGGVVGGIIGAVAGDKVAEWVDQYRINHQAGTDGNGWTFDPKRPEQGWTRITQTGELDYDAMRFSEGMPVYRMQRLAADPVLADELNFKASNRAMELTLSAPPIPQSPYQIPSAAQDHNRNNLREKDWIHDPKSGEWHRQVASSYMERGVLHYRTETASPQRAAELNEQSLAIIARNGEQTPAMLAARYQAGYEQYGWSRHGSVPQAVLDAARHPERLPGSDGDTYTRGQDGEWISKGMIRDSQAEGALKRELDATYQHQQQLLDIKTLEPVQVRPDPQLQQQGDAAGAQMRHEGDQSTASADRQAGGVAVDRNLLLSNQSHPGHDLFQQAKGHVHDMYREYGKEPDQYTDQMAGAVAAQARGDGLSRIDQMMLDDNHERIFSVQGKLGDALTRYSHVPVSEAMVQPLEQSTALFEQGHAQQGQKELAQQQNQQTEELQRAQRSV